MFHIQLRPALQKEMEWESGVRRVMQRGRVALEGHKTPLAALTLVCSFWVAATKNGNEIKKLQIKENKLKTRHKINIYNLPLNLF